MELKEYRRLQSHSALVTATFLVIGLIAFLLSPVHVQAQGPRTSPRKRKLETQITVELITGKEGVGIRAQQWLRVFEDLNVTLRVRRELPDEVPEVEEKALSTSLREVRAIGRLEKDGSLTFPDRKFRVGDGARIKEWITQLRTYGAQGSPEGQPFWGLSKTNFELLFQSLAEPAPIDPGGLTLEAAIKGLELPQAYPLTYTLDTLELLKKRAGKQTEAATVRQSFSGLAKGTTLAIVLNGFDLGFRPRRTPNGSLELAVVPLAESDDVWPVGWPVPESQRLPDVAPQLYKLVKIELENEPLTDVLSAIGDLVEMPVLIDDHGLHAEKIDLHKATVSMPSRQASWSFALKALTFQAKLRRDIWVDERGTPFLWIGPLKQNRKANP